LHLAEAVPLQGGIPVVHRGHVIAAVGVSGASSAAEDNELALLAADAAAAVAQDGRRDDKLGMPLAPARR
jgi:glc operon protein GlcG